MTSGNSGNSSLYHLFCCHNIPKNHESKDWLSPIQEAIELAISGDHKPMKSTISFNELERRKSRSDQKEKKFHQILKVQKTSMRTTYDSYDLLRSSGNRLSPLVVLCIFSGIGETLVALKRNSIAIKAIISVENDPVATHVSRFNHDSSYNKRDVKDEITYIYPTHNLEEMSSQVDDSLFEKGAIDLIIAAPQLEGCDGQLSAIAKVLEQIEKHQLQGGKKVLYMTIANNDVQCCSKLKNELKANPIQIDSKDFSPCSKKSIIWSNIPFRSTKTLVCPQFMEKDFKLPESILQPSNDDLIMKSFQSHTDVDDDRMMKVVECNEGMEKKYKIATISVAERENALGLTKGYVEEAVQDLFDHLKHDAFQVEFSQNPTDHWCDRLDEKFFHFVKCKYQFKPSTDPPFYDIEMAIPSSNLKNELLFFDAETYSKHLIGNACSVPMLEHLLSPLKDICTVRYYDGFNYKFPWLRNS